MASSASREFRGSVLGTGASLDVRTVGFRPRHVRLLNQTGLCVAEWMDDMPDASAMKWVTAGTMSYISSNGITPLSDGFRLGADTDLNVDGELIRWFCVD